MTEQELFNKWLECTKDEPDLQQELISIESQPDEINDRFYRNLEFGTGGLRGVLGAGTNRMNVFTVRKATQGLAAYLKLIKNSPSVAIAFDSRNKSDRFAREAAAVLAGNGIRVYISKELMPTPMLSFSVRHLGCTGGIVITASHNPAKYNGYKAYGADGCQMTLKAAEKVLSYINKLDEFSEIKYTDFDSAVASGQISYIGDDVIEKFYSNVLAQRLNPEVCAQSGLKVVYTPLNGTGNKHVRTILDRIGIKNVAVVPEQELPDGNFPTCPFPNPEIREALNLGIELCKKTDADLLIATDPDCDRVGIAAPDGKGGYMLFSGNEVGAMLLEYICSQRIKNGTMPKNPVTVKTIVTTDLIFEIAKAYGVSVIETLTGFKFIGEQIGELEEKGEESRYIFGFEESYGYLAGTYCRDKDAVVGSMLICEMIAYYRSQGISAAELLSALYKKYCVYSHSQISFTFEGESGMEKMKSIMTSIREKAPDRIGGLPVLAVSDYLLSVRKEGGSEQKLTLPKSDVIGFNLKGGAGVIIRPSGTEPKIKAYYTAGGATTEDALALRKTLENSFGKLINSL